MSSGDLNLRAIGKGRSGRCSSQRAQRLIKFGNKNGTAFDVTQDVRRGSIEANASSLRVDAYLGACAITKLLGVMNGNLVGPVDAADSLERIANKAGLRGKLGIVADMLKLAASADAEVLQCGSRLVGDASNT